ncbi:MAG TPA: choice-of-anchor Q domain-containing protein [Kofleriaceae bacterium]|nr:choice-of-anchor Q domain-containing protein [Kofleriaceae bacterium]
MRLPPPLAAVLLLAAAALLSVAAGCTRRDPDFCCVTADTCAAAGLTDELRPCEIGQACNAYACVAAECATSADCASPEAPRCLDGLCVAGCTIDDDCAGVAGRPRCDVRVATCVGCTAGDQCPAERSICDVEARACRGCTADDECASGVCIEATGACAAEDAIIYVMESGTDAGTCPKAAPCQTLAYAMGLTSPARSVIRIVGGQFHLGNNSIYLRNAVTIDGSDTTLTYGSLPAITVGGAGILEGVRLASTQASMTLIEIIAGGSLGLSHFLIEDGRIEIAAGGVLDAVNITLRSGEVRCNFGGTLALKKSNLEQVYVDSSCKLVLAESRVEPRSGAQPTAALFRGESSQLIENNVFIGSGVETYLMFIGGASGSTFRFNTVVNRSSVLGSAIAIGCDDGVDVTSNIIAYNSTSPVSCVARYSLFDTAAAQEVSRGVGNRSAEIGTFFRGRQAGDFHLTPKSPAIGFGEPGLTPNDIEGNARPAPLGTMPDVGAYEVP